MHPTNPHTSSPNPFKPPTNTCANTQPLTLYTGSNQHPSPTQPLVFPANIHTAYISPCVSLSIFSQRTSPVCLAFSFPRKAAFSAYPSLFSPPPPPPFCERSVTSGLPVRLPLQHKTEPEELYTTPTTKPHPAPAPVDVWRRMELLLECCSFFAPILPHNKRKNYVMAAWLM